MGRYLIFDLRIADVSPEGFRPRASAVLALVTMFFARVGRCESPSDQDLALCLAASFARQGAPPMRKSESFDNSMQAGAPRASPAILCSQTRKGGRRIDPGSAPI